MSHNTKSIVKFIVFQSAKTNFGNQSVTQRKKNQSKRVTTKQMTLLIGRKFERLTWIY